MADEVKLEQAKKLKLAGVIAGVLLLAGAIVVIVWVATKDTSAESAKPASPELVRIEVRALPAMEIVLDGRKLGKTPISVSVPRSDKPLKIDAHYVLTKYEMKNLRNVVEEPHTDTRMVVPDHDRTIDFKADRTPPPARP